jgi:tRNA G18 (ribose-2'-O)-methylase SpoU
MTAAPAETVDDPADPRVADFVGLRDADRQESGVVVVEGLLAARQLEGSRFSARSILVTPNRVADVTDLAAAVDVPVLVASQTVMDAVTGFHIHRGVVASADRPSPLELEAVLASASLVAVLENVTDHENLGALFRNAAAFGVDAVLACPRTADPYYRRSIRVSMGHALRVPFARLDPWPSALEQLRDRGFRVLALTPDRSAVPIDEVPSVPSQRVALLLGAEGPGLTDEAMVAADVRVRIPIGAGVDSLNVATAAAIAFHHFSRAR